jgi:nitrogen fixation protein NifU and related proteins
MTAIVSDTILEYAKNPPNKYRMLDPTIAHIETNRSCGDTMHVYLRIESDTITDFTFEGDTAIITTAAAAMVGEWMVGQPTAKMLEMRYPDVRELLGQDLSPKRQIAACLALLATRNALHLYLRDGKKDDFSDLIDP